MHDQSETFFPLSGEFPGLKSIHVDLQERLAQLRNVAQVNKLLFYNVDNSVTVYFYRK